MGRGGYGHAPAHRPGAAVRTRGPARGLVALVAALAAACAATFTAGCRVVRSSAPREPVPEDFNLSITVTDRGTPDTARDGWADARYILEPDRVLRAGFGNAVTPSVYPPRARRLSEREMLEVWTLVGALGTDDAAPEIMLDSEGAFIPPRDVASALVAVGERGTRWYGLWTGEAADPPGRPIDVLLQRLAELTWRRTPG